MSQYEDAALDPLCEIERVSEVKISHEEYLKRIVHSKKMELENLNISHRIAIAEYETKKAILNKDIDSIEAQLNDK